MSNEGVKMKILTSLAIVLMICTAVVGCAGMRDEVTNPVRVMTFNIRYNNPGDGENAWPNRKNMAASMIRFHRADVVGLQEALRGQIDDLAERLPEYGWFGVGRADGKDAGEFMVIFYRKDRVICVEQSNFWLSETPEIPGKAWDAACERMVTWGKFRDVKTGKTFFHFNTHFDHMGKIARRESAYQLLRSIEDIAGTTPVVVTGDFNAKPDSEPIRIITGGLPENKDTKLTDSNAVSLHGHHGPSGTWSGFTSSGESGQQPIDYVFVKNGVKVLLHGTLSDTFNGRFPSDHMLVLSEVVIE